MAESLGEAEVVYTEFDQLFQWFADKLRERTVIVIDEFPYLVEKDDAIPSVFQLIIDSTFKKKNLMLILCGSSVSMMEKAVLGSKSPLYGRKTGHWKVLPLSFKESCEFFPKNTVEKNIEFFSILGGVPFYLEKFSDSKTTLDNIRAEILSRGGRLYEEVDFLLKEELREPDVYKSILEAIALGKGKINELAQTAKIPVQDLDKYLKVLIRLGFVTRLAPITESPKSKRSRYVISDPFFRFWFRFCEPHKSDLEIGETSQVKATIVAQLPSFVGRAFEDLCADFINRRFPGKWSKIGHWWGAYREAGERKNVEIDIVALNDKTREILFGECKWQEGVSAKKVLSGLKEKAKFVDWGGGERKEYYAVFAKSFKEKVPKSPDQMFFDLKDMEKSFSIVSGKPHTL
jgi:hypothetical protein